MTPAYRALCSVRTQLVEHEREHRELSGLSFNTASSRVAERAKADAFATALAIVEHEIGMLQS